MLFSVLRANGAYNGEGALSVQGWFDYNGGYGFNDPGTRNQTLPQNQWVHYAFVRSGSNGTYYVNGAQLGPMSTTAASKTYGNINLFIGGDATVSSGGFCNNILYCFTGTIGQVVILNTALGAAEMRRFYAASLPFFGGSAPPPSSPALSTGAIVGISVAGGVTLLGGATGLAVYQIRKMKNPGPPSQSSRAPSRKGAKSARVVPIPQVIGV